MYPVERVTGVWQSVVAGFDGGREAALAVRWAADQAAARCCPLHLVRVLESPAPAVAAGWVPIVVGPDEAQRRRVEDELLVEVDACRNRDPMLEVHAAVHDGPRCSRLAEHADLVGADVLVVGSSDRGTLSRLVFGSTGAGLLRLTRRTVVVVRELTPVQEAGMATGYAPVVAVVEGAETSRRVLGFAFDMADRWDAPLVVTHVDQASRSAAAGAGEVPIAALGRQLAGMGRGHRRVPVRVDPAVARSTPSIVDLSADARLVVVGDCGHGSPRGARAGSIGRTLLRHGGCSVAFVS